jgi:outer membrane usher protein
MRWGVVALALLTGAPLGTALADAPVRLTAKGQSRLLLEVWVDGRTDHAVAAVTLDDDKVFMRAEDLAAVGIKFKAEGDTVNLAQITGLSATVDRQNQRLVLSVAADRLPVQTFDLRSAQPSSIEDPQRSATGAIFRYDLSATGEDLTGRSMGSAGGTGTLDVFTPSGLLTVSGFATGDASGFKGARLDTALQFDREDSLSHLIIGDAVMGGPGWSRGLRFGGIEYASDFSIRPDLVTMPLPVYFGQSQVPTTVEVFDGAAKVFEQNVQPGPFELRNLPIITGGGTATVVTRDVLGRETSQSIALYTGADLLAPGLSSFIADAGFRRTGYGINSVGYDTPMAAGTYRLGLDDGLTVQGHGEASPDLAMMGGGLAAPLGGFGLVGFDLAGSGSKAGNGLLAAVSGEARHDRFNFDFSATLATAQFRDLASIDGVPPPRLRFSADVNANFGAYGTAGIGWIGSKIDATSSSNFVTASYSVPLKNGAFFALSALHDVNSRHFDAEISLVIPLGGRAMASMTAQVADASSQGTAVYDVQPDGDGGAGYRLMGQFDRDVRAEGDARWIGRNADADGAISVYQGQTALRADASGALVAIGGSVFASHDPGAAVALVRAGDPGIRVYRENREIGKTDSDGELLLTGLDAYAPNHIAVDPRDYPFDAMVETPDRLVRPQRRSGVVVNMAPEARHPVIAILTRGLGTAVPVGALVTLAGSPQVLITGRNGQVFIPDLPAASEATVDLGNGRCHVRIEPVAQTGLALPRTAPLLCVEEVSLAR